MGRLTDETNEALERSRKKMRSAPMPDDVGSRDFYTRNRDTMQGIARHIASEIPAAQFVPGSLLPKKDLLTMAAKQKKRQTEGSLDPGAIGKCGESGASCPALYKDGYRACTGIPIYDERGMVKQYGTPCPYAKAGIKLPITKGLYMVDAFRR